MKSYVFKGSSAGVENVSYKCSAVGRINVGGKVGYLDILCIADLAHVLKQSGGKIVHSYAVAVKATVKSDLANAGHIKGLNSVGYLKVGILVEIGNVKKLCSLVNEEGFLSGALSAYETGACGIIVLIIEAVLFVGKLSCEYLDREGGTDGLVHIRVTCSLLHLKSDGNGIGCFYLKLTVAGSGKVCKNLRKGSELLV